MIRWSQREQFSNYSVDLPAGSRYRMSELQRMVAMEPWRTWGVDGKEAGYVHIDLNELSLDSDDNHGVIVEKRQRHEVKNTLIDNLIKHCERKAKGTRLTHKGAAHDIEHTKAILMSEVSMSIPLASLHH